MLIKNVKVFKEIGAFEAGEICIDGEFFSDYADGAVYDGEGCYAIPGLVDIHFHGCVGEDFSDADEKGLRAIARFEAAHGTTSICPTTLTLPEEQLARTCKRIAALGESGGARVVGIHLEGPFISYNMRGAQNPEFIRQPDTEMVRRLQAAAGGLIKTISLAPELPGATGLIEECGGEIICSIAHTEASYEIAMEAFYAGARKVTHLYNAMQGLYHRSPGVIGAAMDYPKCHVELICDGVHIHPSVVRATFRMFGDDKVIFVSDSMMATGMADGKWELGGLEVEVSGRYVHIVDTNTIAGSVSPLIDCVRVAVQEMGLAFESAVKCATVNPAKAIGVFDKVGSIEAGKYADLVLLNEDLSIKQVFLSGKLYNA